MNLSPIQTHEQDIGESFVGVGKLTPRSITTKRVTIAEEKRRLLPFISLLYILNGNHDPRMVQRLNIFLALLFVIGGVLSGWDLLPVGCLFAAIAAVNGANLWYIKRRSNYSLYPVSRDILTQIELWTRTAIRRRLPR